MSDPDFARFGQRLLAGGVAPSHAHRIAAELAEHYRDLRDEAERIGLGSDDALQYAEDRLGDPADVAAAVFSERDLRRWMYRYPGIARLLLPLAYTALLPAVPLLAGVNHAPLLARWGACLLLSALFTAALMLCLYLSILAP